MTIYSVKRTVNTSHLAPCKIALLIEPKVIANIDYPL